MVRTDRAGPTDPRAQAPVSPVPPCGRGAAEPASATGHFQGAPSKVLPGRFERQVWAGEDAGFLSIYERGSGPRRCRLSAWVLLVDSPTRVPSAGLEEDVARRPVRRGRWELASRTASPVCLF